MSISPGASSDRENARVTQRVPGVPGGMDHATSFVGGNLVGREASGRDEVRGLEPGEGTLPAHEEPIGSALAAERGRHPRRAGDDVPRSRTEGLE
ncbi:MAG: hypothetical protein HOQ02_04035 [Lysobacter sp.]|nr:hypothetical protein [Lysobacter sp.]